MLVLPTASSLGGRFPVHTPLVGRCIPPPQGAPAKYSTPPTEQLSLSVPGCRAPCATSGPSVKARLSFIAMPEISTCAHGACRRAAEQHISWLCLPAGTPLQYADWCIYTTVIPAKANAREGKKTLMSSPNICLLQIFGEVHNGRHIFPCTKQQTSSPSFIHSSAVWEPS